MSNDMCNVFKLLIVALLTWSGLAMPFSATGEATGTETNLSGMLDITGATSRTEAGITTYYIPAQLTIASGADVSYDATVENFICTGNQNNQLNISGTLTALGGQATSSFGTGSRVDTYPTAFSLNKNNKPCCNNGSITIRNSGRLNLYGVRCDVSAVIQLQQGSGGIIRNSLIYCRQQNNTRIRVEGAEHWDIDRLDVINMQFDWLTDQAFTNLLNFRSLNGGQPIENALGAVGATRLWTKFPDPRGFSNAAMNNWQGQKDVQIEYSEAGTGAKIVPDNANGSGAGGHGGRIFHWFVPSAISNSGLVNGKCFVRDTNNGKRKRTTSAGTINHTDDQFIITPIANSTGALTRILTGMWYRNNAVGDISNPDGNEVLDARGKRDVTADVADDSERDLFDLHFKGLDWEYASASTIQLKGLEEINIVFGVLLDTGRNSDSEALIAAYTDLNVQGRPYNYMKYWSTLDVNLETPSSAAFLFTPSNNFGSYDVTINGSGGDLFNFSSDLITFRASELNDDITTTGDVTLNTHSNKNITANSVMAGTHRVSGDVMADYHIKLPITLTNQVIATLVIDDAADDPSDNIATINNCFIGTIVNLTGGEAVNVVLNDTDQPNLEATEGELNIRILAAITIEPVGITGLFEMVLLADNSVLQSQTDSGEFVIDSIHLGKEVYFRRRANNETITSTINRPTLLAAGDNGAVELYDGGNQLNVTITGSNQNQPFIDA